VADVGDGGAAAILALRSGKRRGSDSRGLAAGIEVDGALTDGGRYDGMRRVASDGGGRSTTLDLEIDPNALGTLDIESDIWVSYLDMNDASMVPTRLKVGERDYVWDSSMLAKGWGALMPGKIRELREGGKDPLIVERGDRYYIFVSAA
jgi:hypothetical protein